MDHRHLTHRRYTLAALDDLLENGTLADWQPLLGRIRRDPYGDVAERVLHLLRSRDFEETGAFWFAYIEKARARRSSVRQAAGQARP